MTFVDKSLEGMVQEVGSNINSPIIDTITDYGVETFERIHADYVKILQENIRDKKNVDYLRSDPEFSNSNAQLDAEMGIVDFLIENAYYRGYNKEPGKQITVKYYFGIEGVVIQVIDQGVGFNVDKIVGAFSTGSARKRKHFHEKGWGMRTMLKPEFEVNIQSSTEAPAGTTVTLMYKYQY